MVQKIDRFTKLFLPVTLTIALATSCGSNSAPNATNNLQSSEAECQAIKHEAGQTKICGHPTEIVALGPYMLGILLSLGVQPAGYAETRYIGSNNFGEKLQQIKYLGKYVNSNPINVGTRNEPSLEVLVKLNPDLILGEGTSSQKFANLSRIAPTLLFTGSEDEEWKSSLKKIAQALGREEKAQQVIKAHEQRVAEARADLAPVASQKKVLLLDYNPSMSGFGVDSGESYAGGLLEDLGFPLVTPTNKQAELISLEALPQLAEDADIIFVMASGNSSVAQVRKKWEETSLLRKLPASQAQQVYFVDYQLWSRTYGPIAAKLMIDQIRELLLESN